jgi:hypothetical protein
MLEWFSADPSYILNGQDVCISCLDGLLQTHLISEMAKISEIYLQVVLNTINQNPSTLYISVIKQQLYTKPSKHDM